MSRKLFNKAKQITENFTSTINYKKLASLKNITSKNILLDNSRWKPFNQQFASLHQRFSALKPKIQLDQYAETLLRFKKGQNQNGEANASSSPQPAKQTSKEVKGQNRSQQTSEKSWFPKDKLESLKSAAEQRFSQLQESVRKQKENLSSLKGTNSQNQSSKPKKWKQNISEKLKSIQQRKEQLMSNFGDRVKQAKAKGLNSAQEKIKQAKAQKLSQIKNRLKQLENYLSQQKNSIKEKGEQGSEILSQSADKLKGAVKDKISQVASTKAEIISKLISKLFWRIALLIGVASFAYGMGTSLPRELREHLHLIKKQDKDSKDALNQQQEGKQNQ